MRWKIAWTCSPIRRMFLIHRPSIPFLYLEREREIPKRRRIFFPTEGNEKTGSLLVTKLFGSFSKRERGVSVKKTSCPCFYFYTIWVSLSLPDGEEPNSDWLTMLSSLLLGHTSLPFFLPSNKTFFSLSLGLIVSNQLGRTVRQKLPRLSELQTCKHVISSVGELSRFGSNGSRTEDGDCF